MADHDVAHDLTIGLGDESPLWHVVAGSSDPIDKYSFCFRLKRRRNDSADRVGGLGGLGADDNGSGIACHGMILIGSRLGRERVSSTTTLPTRIPYRLIHV